MTRPKKISIVIPILNEEEGIPLLYKRISETVIGRPYEFEFVFVNDGSTDRSLSLLTDLSTNDPRVVVLDLARNFGQHLALTAGIDHAQGDAVILMDADMEDEPEHIWNLISVWEEGFEVVYVIRGERKGSLIRRLGFTLYHWLNRRLEQRIPTSGNFSLIDAKVLRIFRQLREQNRYIPGLRSWVGFKQKGIRLDRGVRYDNRPRVPFTRLVRLALDSYVGFSRLPLKLASMTGILFAGIGFVAILVIFILKFTVGFAVAGWASMVVIIIFTSGIQLLCLGIMGEYVGRILDETKGRPLYLIRSRIHKGLVEDL